MYFTQPTFRVFTMLAAMLFVGSLSMAVEPKPIADEEKKLLALLRSNEPFSEKAIACKKLAIFGSNEAVPELAKLLPDPQLSSWARIALEAIPGDEADKALRNVSQTLEGRLLVGTINSIGVRRDARAVESLAERLRDNDVEVASAAAVALGLIGGDSARQSLRNWLTDSRAEVRNAVAEGLVLCAERLQAGGRSDDAAELYDEIRQADVPLQRVVEATRGAILARGEDGIPLLLDTLRSDEMKLFQLALGTARELPGRQVDVALADELARMAPPRAALLVQAMADRTATVDVNTLLGAAQQGELAVRLSAIEALGRVGDVSCLAPLMQMAGESNADVSPAAIQTLANLPGKDVDEEIVSRLSNTSGSAYQLLLQLVGQRRIQAERHLLQALDDTDPAVRGAALNALGETLPRDRLSVLISQVVEPKHSEDWPVAVQALTVAAVRMPDREACATELANATQGASSETTSALLEILSRVGGSKALDTLAAAAKGADPQLQDTSSRLLGKWNSVDAAPVLLDLAKTAPSEKYQIRALRGYIGLVRKFTMTQKQRAEMCQMALDAAQRSQERELVLDVLQIHPSIPGLKIALAAQQSDSREKANAAVQAIAEKLRQKGVDLSRVMPK